MDSVPLRVVENVACTGCGCVCDDLRLTIEGDQIVRAEGACEIAEPWLLAQNRLAPPVAEIEGQPAPLEQALAEAARILRHSRSPLFYGLSRSNIDGQRAAVALAERLGATIDTTASLCHAPSIMALQQSGESTSTLGEVSNRADLVVFWGSDPLTTHPRHWERYSVEPAGKFLPRGRADRFVVVVDVTRSRTAEAADLFIPVSADRHFDALWSLRGLVHGVTPDWSMAPDLPAAALVDLAERMKRCRCGVVFFGVGLSRPRLGHRNVQALLELVTDLNDHAHWYVRRMRVQGNVTGADSVLAWQTGYPFSVNLARGYPRFNPDEYSVSRILQRGEADACLLVGSETLEWLPREAVESLRQIPTVVLDPPEVECAVPPTVRIRTAVPGVHLGGTAYRMDGVPIPLSAPLTPRYPSDEAILGQVLSLIDPQPG